MLKLLKLLNKSIGPLIFVTVLLILQAACDLSLPTYTSDIINVGIARGGIIDTVPKVIRATQYDRLSLFMTEDEKVVAAGHFTLLQKENVTEREWSDYLDEYPALSRSELYLWDGEQEEGVSGALSAPMMLLLALTNEETGAQTRQQILAGLQTSLPANLFTQLTQGTDDIFVILANMPDESRAAIVGNLRGMSSEYPEALLTAGISSYIKSEYEAVGLNVGKLQTNYILSVGLKMIGLAFVAMLASILVTFLASRISAKMGRTLRSGLFSKVLSFSNKEMDQFSTASLITRSTNDIQQIQMMVVMLIRIAIYAPILAIGGILKVRNTGSSMTWVLAVAVAAIFVIIGVLFVVAMPRFKLMPKLMDRINQVLREIITGLPVIRAFSTQEHEKKRFDKANIDLKKNQLFTNRVMTIMFPLINLIMNLTAILIIWVSADRIDQGMMQLGDMIAFIQYTMQIIMSFLMLTMLTVMIPRAGVSANRICEVLETEAVIRDPGKEELIPSNQKGVLEFRKVHFRYPGAEEEVLLDINFIARPGETTAIIGSTGSGKSTLVNLIPRFYDATEGSILLNGTDIRKMKQHTLREKLGYVPQKGVLFSGTIESNINFGAPDAGEEGARLAARIAQAEEFITAKQEGYEAPISEGGTNVSGGQKQRLSIARAIAKKPEIYIFDDSLSALDYQTDARLRKAMREELSDAAILIVAQRVSTIMHAEQIIVLDEGRIAGKGTHKELLKNCEVYQQIASSQLSEEELNYE